MERIFLVYSNVLLTVTCPVDGWSTCPIIIGTANMTHDDTLTEDELLYNLYSLTGQINTAIRQYSMSPDTEVIYIGHKDVAADFSMLVRNIPRGQTMSATQSEYLSQVMGNYLNSTLSSDSRALSVVIRAQLAVKNARQLTKGRQTFRRRLMDVGLGDVQVTGRIYGLQRSFLKGDQFLQELSTALVDQKDSILVAMRQQLMLPSEINRDDSYSYFENVTSFDVTLQLFDPPGSDQDDAPIPDSTSGSTPEGEEKNGESAGKGTVIGVGVGVTVGIILVILAGIAAYHFFFFKENGSKAGKFSDTDDGDEGSFANDEESFHYEPSALRVAPGRSKSFDSSGHSSSSRNAPIRSKSTEGAITYDEKSFRRKQEEPSRPPRRIPEHRNSFGGSSHSASTPRQLPERSKSTEGAILYRSNSFRSNEPPEASNRSESGRSLDRSNHSLPARKQLLRSKSCEGAIVYDATLNRRKPQENPSPPPRSVVRSHSLDGSEHSMRSTRTPPRRSKSSQGSLHYDESPFTSHGPIERSVSSRSARGPPSRSSSNGSLYGGIVMQSSCSLDGSTRSCRSARSSQTSQSVERSPSSTAGRDRDRSSRPCPTNRASLEGFLEHHESRMAEQQQHRMHGARSVQLPSRSQSIRKPRPAREFEDASRRPAPSRSHSDTFESRECSVFRQERGGRNDTPSQCDSRGGPRRSKSDQHLRLDDHPSPPQPVREARPHPPQRGSGCDSAPRLPASREARSRPGAELPQQRSGSSSRSLLGHVDRSPAQPNRRQGGGGDGTRSVHECRSLSSSSLSSLERSPDHLASRRGGRGDKPRSDPERRSFSSSSLSSKSSSRSPSQSPRSPAVQR